MKSSNKKKKKEISGRRALFLFWVVASTLWLGFAAYSFNLSRATDAWALYGHYERMIQNGASSDYTRQAYMRATDRLNDVSREIGLFIIIGIGLPVAVLAVGAMMMRKSK